MDIEKKKYRVFFCSNKNLKVGPGEILIRPVQNSWNDFGYRIWCEYTFQHIEESKSFSGEILLGFIPSQVTTETKVDSPIVSLSDYLSMVDSELVPVNEGEPTFFTLLPSMAGYREVVDHIGVKNIEAFLHSINDLVYNKTKSNNWIDKAIKTEVFRLGFMRNSESFYAFNNAEITFAGMEKENFSSLSAEFDLEFQLSSFENPHKINFRFSSEGYIPRRINVLIGKNGLGKSQALKNFTRAALMYRQKDIKLTDAKTSRRPMISRLLAISTPGETGNTFPAERPLSQKLFYRRLNLTRNGRVGRSRSIGETLVQLARKEERIAEKDRAELFLESLEKVMSIETLHIKLDDRRFVPLIDFFNVRGHEKKRLEMWGAVSRQTEPYMYVNGKHHPLSSGQLTYFKFALLCCQYIETGSLVLMDEPETHLHPNLISDFVNLLDYLLENTGSHAILATHSAFITREIPKQQVHVFQVEDRNRISISNPRLRTFGATVDTIAQFVFDEDIEASLTDKIFDRIKELDLEQIERELRNEISLAALMDIRRRKKEVK